MQKIAFHGVPRSGTTWLGSIFDSSPHVAYRHQPLFSYAFKSFLSDRSTCDEINYFFDLLKSTNDDFILQKTEKETGAVPSFSKKEITHVIYKEARYHNILSNLLNTCPDIMVVGIVRNPKSVLSSWYNAPKEFDKTKWNLFDEWKNAPSKNQNRKEEFYGYNKWKEVSLLFLELKEKYPDRFYLINYKNILNDTLKEINDLFRFCELDITQQTIDFIKKSKEKDLSSDAYAVYRKNQTDDKWQKTLPREIINEIDSDLSGTVLEQFNK